MKLIRGQGLRWPDIQWMFDADRRFWSGRRETGCVAMLGTTVEVTLLNLQALRQASTTIQVIEEFQEMSSNGTNALRCIGLNRFTGRNSGVRTAEVREISGQNAACPAIRGPEITLFSWRHLQLLRKKQRLLPRLGCWRHLRKAM